MHRIALLALVVGCGSKDEPKKDPAVAAIESMAKGFDDMAKKQRDRKPTGTPRPQDKLTATVDGKPVKMVSALAARRWDGQVQITVSSVPLTCAEVTGNGRSIYPDEVTFEVNVDDTLQPDGSLAPSIKQTYFAGMSQQQTKPATGTIAAEPGKASTLDVDFETHDAGGSKTLAVKGTIDALGCEPGKPMEAVAPPPPEMPATIEIAGKKLPVRSALVRLGKWPSLRLATGGETCKSSGPQMPSDFALDLTWMSEKKPEEIGQITLGGRLLGNAMDQTFDKSKAKVTPARPTGSGDYTLDIDVTAFKYPVKVTGKVTAVECP